MVNGQFRGEIMDNYRKKIRSFRLEDRIFIYILVFSIIMSFLLIIENTIIDYPWIANVKWIITILLASLFLYCMMNYIFVKLVQITFISILVIVLMPIGWLNSSLHNPFTIAYAFIFCIGIVFFFEGLAQFIMISLLLVVVMTMTALTFLKPEIFLNIDDSVQFWDSMLQIPLTFLIAVVMLRTFSTANRNNLKLLEKINKDLIYVTLHDELTGIFNRRYIFQQLNEMKNNKQNETILLGMIDIDDFKRINDTFGHEEGDSLLKDTASFIQNQLDSYGFVGRYGGDEFIIVIHNNDLQNQQRFFIQLKKFSEMMHQKNDKASFSGGFVRCNTQDNLNNCLARADKFLYEAKKAGKNCFCIDGEFL